MSPVWRFPFQKSSHLTLAVTCSNTKHFSNFYECTISHQRLLYLLLGEDRMWLHQTVNPVKLCFYSSHSVNRKAIFTCTIYAACWLIAQLSVACWVLSTASNSSFLHFSLVGMLHAFDRHLEKNPLVLKALWKFEKREFWTVILSSERKCIIMYCPQENVSDTKSSY